MFARHVLAKGILGAILWCTVGSSLCLGNTYVVHEPVKDETYATGASIVGVGTVLDDDGNAIARAEVRLDLAKVEGGVGTVVQAFTATSDQYGRCQGSFESEPKWECGDYSVVLLVGNEPQTIVQNGEELGAIPIKIQDSSCGSQ